MDLFEKFSSRENLKKAFEYLKKEISKSSLPLDPIWNPGIESIEKIISTGNEKFFESLEYFLRNTEYSPDKAAFLYAMKDNLGIRPISILSVADRLIYQAIFNPSVLGNIIDKKLFRNCFGNRIKGDEDNYFHPYQDKWVEFCDEQIKHFEKGFYWRVVLDIKGFYESISTEKLFEIFKNDFSLEEERVLRILKNQLSTWTETEGVPVGIPQGPKPSGVIANAYLYPLDIFIDSLTNEKLKHFRYIDDIVLMGKGKDDILNAVNEINLFIRKYNLRLNEKTKLSLLKDSTPIEEVRFHNDYGEINEQSTEKITKIQNELPSIIDKIKSEEEIKPSRISDLKYYLKDYETNSREKKESLKKLVDIIALKPFLVDFFCLNLSYLLTRESECHEEEIVLKYDKEIYDKIKSLYNGKATSTWMKFWLIRIMPLFDNFFKEDSFLESEFSRIIESRESNFLKPLAFIFKNQLERIKFFNQVNDGLKTPFDIDDLKRSVLNASSNVEKAIYYYLANDIQMRFSDEIFEFAYEAMRDKSLEVQFVGFALAMETSAKIRPEIEANGEIKQGSFEVRREHEFAWIHSGVREEKKDKNDNHIKKDNKNEEGGNYLTFEGKIDKGQFSKLDPIKTMIETMKPKKRKSNRLIFYPDSGDFEYKNELGHVKNGTKGFALLSFLNDNKNSPFNIADITAHANEFVNKSIHKFKKEKDIDDTIREIRNKVKVKKNAYFPIFKTESFSKKAWKWLEK